TGGLALIFYLVPSLFFNFLSNAEIIQFDEIRKSADPNQLSLFISNLEQARISIFKADAIRSFFFILLGGLVLWLYSIKKMGWKILVSALAVLFLIDMATVCYRYLNNENFVRKSKVTKPYQASAADREIFKDTNPDFRVLNIAVNTFNDASTSYFHKSIGGYHGAKLRRYQELIDHQISPEKEKIVNTLTNNPTLLSINNTLGKLPVLNMLNTKYIIYDPGRSPLINNSALGNAWFVENYKIVENADEEIAALNNFNPDRIAIVDKRFEDNLKGKEIGNDTLSVIKLTEYQPNHLVYSSNSSADQLAIFSEIYYDKGWNAYIDGKPAPYFRADYVLRAMIVPASDHTIEFKFEPRVYKVGEKVSLISSLLLFLLLIGGLYYETRKIIKSKKIIN
ncbi:MAG: YfhO family protein, partial [Bacteroidales bacterium]|nr:YfhO family protein [Bacteroidales bacterium]